MTPLQKRLPRFQRQKIRPFQLTPRDLDVIRLVARHRFLTSPQICSVVDGAKGQILRRLQFLYHAGYLDRPRCQLDYYHSGGSKVMVYGLASRGAGLMRQKFDLPFSRMDWDTRKSRIGRIFLQHAVMTAGIVIAFELAALASGGRVKFINPDDDREATSPNPFKLLWQRWKTSLGGKRLALIPDAAFLLEYPDEPEGRNRRLCLIEADRGTMPLRRSRGSASCIEGKLQLYTQLWKSGQLAQVSGAHRVQVWIVTTSAERVANMEAAFAKLPSGRGLFRFVQAKDLNNPALLLDW